MARKLLWGTGVVAAIVLVIAFVLFYYVPSSRSNQPLVGTVTRSNGGSTMLLIFSKTAGYRHASIENGIDAIHKLAAVHHVEVQATEDSSVFTDENLARYRAVIFLSTTGNILDDAQKAAFERYIRAGGGFVGVHAASDTEYSWTWYGQLVGSFFKNHPAISPATVRVEDGQNRSTSMLPEKWERTDEWYNYRENPRNRVHVLLTLDESTYKGGEMGSDHPVSWYHEFDGGRAWYTGMGHTAESFAEPLFLAHLWGGISYAAKIES